MTIPAHNAIIGWRPWTQEAVFTASSAVAGYPASHLGTLPLSLVWRSASAAAADTQITATFSTLRRVDLVAIGPHNWNIGSTYRVLGYFDEAGTQLVFDTGVQQTWPSVFDEEVVDWDGGRWWDRTYVQEEVQGYPWYRPVYIPGANYVRRVEVLVNDIANADGFVQACRVELAEAIQLPVNFDFGAAGGYRSRSEVKEADGGGKFGRRRRSPRRFRCSVPYLPEATADQVIEELYRLLDTDRPFFFWRNPTDEKNLVRHAFLVHFTALDDITYAAPSRKGVTLTMEEWL